MSDDPTPANSARLRFMDLESSVNNILNMARLTKTALEDVQHQSETDPAWKDYVTLRLLPSQFESLSFHI